MRCVDCAHYVESIDFKDWIGITFRYCKLHKRYLLIEECRNACKEFCKEKLMNSKYYKTKTFDD